MAESQSASAFLENWHALVDQAAQCGLIFPEPVLVMMLLSALPTSWKSFITTQSTAANLSLLTLSGQILQEEVMSNPTSSSGQASSPMAMAAKMTRPARRPFGRPNKYNPRRSSHFSPPTAQRQSRPSFSSENNQNRSFRQVPHKLETPTELHSIPMHTALSVIE